MSDLISREAAIGIAKELKSLFLGVSVGLRGNNKQVVLRMADFAEEVAVKLRALPAATDAVGAAAPKVTPFDRFTQESWDAYDERGMDLTVAECTRPAPASAGVTVVDDSSVFARVSELGNQIHNLSCEHQNNEALAGRLQDLRTEAWDISRILAAMETSK